MDAPPNGSDLLELYMQVARTLGQVMHEAAMHHGITSMQAMALLHVGSGPALTRTIAAHLHCDPSNATGLVDQLERRGLVRRTTPPEDRRRRMVQVTHDGLVVTRALRAALADNGSRFDRLRAPERTELRRMLEVLAAEDPGKED